MINIDSKIIKYFSFIVSFWTVCLLALWVYIYHVTTQQFNNYVHIEAQTVLNKDLSLRIWATMHGGVYVPPTEKTPPNPYLEFLPERDVVTTGEKALTLMNPAYMIRQVMEEFEGTYGIKGHITSLNPINPLNAPDEWEASVLKGFESNLDSRETFARAGDKRVFRKMIPLLVRKECLKCHAKQGYKEGDIRGGLSVTMPITAQYATNRAHMVKTSALLTGIYLLGLIGLVYAARKNMQASKTLQQSESLLRIAQRTAHMGHWSFNPVTLEIKGSEELLRIYDLPVQTGALADFTARVHPEDHAYVMNRMQHFIETGEHGELEFRIIPGGSNVKWVHCIINPIRGGNGEVIEVAGTTQDITERKNTEQKILTALGEKEVLLKEVHHRVKNNMAIISSLLSLQAGQLTEEKYLDMFTDSQNRIRAMALVHELLYKSDDFSSINAMDYINALAQNIRDTFSRNNELQISTDILPINISIDDLVPLGLLINEILSNVYKHGFDGEHTITVSITLVRHSSSHLELTITDDGRGFPSDFDREKSRGLGLKLVDALAAQINGELRIEHNPTRFTLIFPDEIKHARHLRDRT